MSFVDMPRVGRGKQLACGSSQETSCRSRITREFIDAGLQAVIEMRITNLAIHLPPGRTHLDTSN